MVSSDKPKIGILAGGGELPKELAYRLKEQKRAFFIIGFEGFVEPYWLHDFPHQRMRLAGIGKILRVLRQEKCEELILIGPIKRPSWRDFRPDFEGARLLARLGKAIFLGDNGLLASIISLLEEEGFRIRGAHEFLFDKKEKEGPLGLIKPQKQDLNDISYGKNFLKIIAPFDIGQACIVHLGRILAVEGAEGTDQMIARYGQLEDSYKGAILVKMPKIGQDLRVDMPTIGPNTIEYAARAGLKVIAFLGEETLFLEKDFCVQKANNLEICLYGFAKEGEV